MSAKFYVTPAVTALFIYLYFGSFWQHISGAKLDFEPAIRGNGRETDINQYNRYNPYNTYNPYNVLELLKEGVDLGTAQQILNEKRNVDLGLNRGFSGMKEAKHLIGLSMANGFNNPGKRRRRRSPSPVSH